MKKIFNITISVCLTIFSFYYTDKLVQISKNEDIVMKNILVFKDNYETSYVDAKVIDNYIIPGIRGKKIDVDKSYNKMKELGYYNENLYIYIEEKPKISIENIYNKYIINGNLNKSQVSLVFNLKNSNNLNTILYILKENNVVANFFIDGKYFKDDINSLKDIVNNNNFLGNLGYDGKYDKTSIKETNSIIKKIINYDNDFCYVTEYDYKTLNICSKLKMYTVKGNEISNTKAYLDIKEKLTNGGIYKLDNNNYTIEELGIIIKYIKQKGYEIVSLPDLISEKAN